MIRMVAVCTVLAIPAVAQDVDGYTALLELAVPHADAELEGHKTGWGMFDIDRVDFTLAESRLDWGFPDGRTTHARAEMIGEWQDGAFTWAWAMRDMPPGTTAVAEAARAYGQIHGIAELTDTTVFGDLGAADDLASVVSYVTDVTGVYAFEWAGREGAWAFFGFYDITVEPAE